MDEKGKSVVIVATSFIIAIILGYTIMYIKSPRNIINENNTTIDKNDKDELNFNNFLYDIDGNDDKNTSIKVSNGAIYLKIDKNEYIIKDYKNVTSVRVAHSSKDPECNIIYILSDNRLYYVTDTEFEIKKKNKVKKIFEEVPIEDVESFAIISETDEENGYKYPAVYLKIKSGKVFVSHFGSEFKINKEE